MTFKQFFRILVLSSLYSHMTKILSDVMVMLIEKIFKEEYRKRIIELWLISYIVILLFISDEVRRRIWRI